MLMLLNRNKRKFDDFLACLVICLLFNIIAYGNAYAHKTYEYIWKLVYFSASFSLLHLTPDETKQSVICDRFRYDLLSIPPKLPF